MRKILMFSFLAVFVAAPVVAEAAVHKSKRRLLVVSSLEKFGSAKYAWLYRFLDGATISAGVSALGGSYAGVSMLPEPVATQQNFINVLRSLTNHYNTLAVDVILSLHGAQNKLWFFDGSVSTGDLKDAMREQIPKRHKLRLMYNLACYGSSHRNEFRSAGFRTVIGARKVNAASASEYPTFLSMWKAGSPVNAILSVTNNDPALGAADMAARGMGFSDADSRKWVSGTSSLRIHYNAQ